MTMKYFDDNSDEDDFWFFNCIYRQQTSMDFKNLNTYNKIFLSKVYFPLAPTYQPVKIHDRFAYIQEELSVELLMGGWSLRFV